MGDATKMQIVQILMDLTIALVKMDIKEMDSTALVKYCLPQIALSLKTQSEYFFQYDQHVLKYFDLLNT